MPASSTFTATAVLLDSATLADGNTRFASARDTVWESTTGASMSATSAALLANAPSLKDNADVQALAALRDRSGNLQTTEGVIAGTPTNPAPHTTGATLAELDDALDTTPQAAEASTGPSPGDPSVASQAVDEARGSQTALALQSGFLTGGTSAAKDIVEQVAASAVQVTLLAMSFNVSQQTPTSRTPSTPSSPWCSSPSRVSAQLSDISQKLDRAVIDIEQARVQIGQMYDSLSRLHGSLDAVQNNILEALRNGTKSQLRQTINSALGYEERNNSPLPLSAFNDAAAYLHTFATVTARHGPELNTDFPSFDIQNDANQLSTGIASNVDFLDQLPAERGWTSARLSRTVGDAPQLANMDDFVLASRAYAELMLENPRYVSAGYRRWLSDIQQLGTPLADLTSAIATSDTPDGTHSTLLNHLFCARTMAAFAPTTMGNSRDSAATQAAGIQHIYSSMPLNRSSLGVAAATYTDHDFLFAAGNHVPAAQPPAGLP